MTAAAGRTYGTLARRSEGRRAWWEIGAIEPHVAIRLKQLFPRIARSSAPPWRFPAEPAVEADLAWFTSRYPLAMADDDARAMADGRGLFEATRTRLTRVLAGDYTAPEFARLRDGQHVRAYQAQAVTLLQGSGGLLLGDEVGLGKTYSAAAAMLMPGALPAIVVAHAHLQAQWCRVIEGFTTLRAHPIRGTRPYELPPADVYVYRWSQLVGWADVAPAIGAHLVVFDEIQELRRGVASQKGSAARRIAEAASFRLGLSATPIYNYGVEIWQVMQFLRAGLLGAWNEFAREWCGGAATIRDPDALGGYLREHFAFLRRTKRDVGQEVPAVNRIVDVVDHDEDKLVAIETRARDLARRTTVGAFVERGQAMRDLDLLVRHWTGVAKARAVAQFARILVEGGEPIVLVGWHRDVYAIWLRELADLAPALYTGSESAAAKGRSAERFLAGETSILILSLRSGAGLDGLQRRASTIVFGELDWSPGVHHQCIGRLDREGQRDPVTAIFLVAEDGSDPPMMEVLGLKASEAAHILDPGLGALAVHGDYGRVQTLVRRYLDRRGGAHAPAPAALEVAS